MSFENPVIDPTERLRILATSIGGEIGVPFLETLVKTLKNAMEADFVLITLGAGSEVARARAIFAIKDGEPVENLEYDLEGTPCQFVCRGDTIVVPCNLSDRFPREEGFCGYVGVPLRNGSGGVIGNLAVFSKKPIPAPDDAESIVRIFGARIEADMHHKRLEHDRETLIAELEHTNETLKGRNQALHDANQSKTALMGMVAHDLRNPLAALVAQIEVLQTVLNRQETDTAKINARIDKIQSSADRLAGIIDATLVHSRCDSGKLHLRRRHVDVSSLVMAAIETNATEAQRKSISVVFADAKPCWASLDDGLCLEAIDNLVSNAIKYSEPKTEVNVAVAFSAAGITIRVKDQGQGLSEDDMRKVFQPFQKLSAQPTCGESSTGLGLANVQAVAQAHGGVARVHSAGKGLGAVFELVLPVPDSVRRPRKKAGCAPKPPERSELNQ